MTYIHTLTGRKFYPTAPTEHDYCITDIAHGLSNTCRFSGQGLTFYSVAQHSVLVSDLCKEYPLWGLLHDASEAYLTDLPSPIKHLPELRGYRDIEARTMDAICGKFGLPLDEPIEVEQADRVALRIEAKCLGLFADDWEGAYLPDPPYDLKPLTPYWAEKAFMESWRMLQ